VCCAILICVISITAVYAAKSDDILTEISKRQLIIAGKAPGSRELARKEIRDLLKDLSREQGYEQVEKGAQLFVSAMKDLDSPLEYYKGFKRLDYHSAYLPSELGLVTFVDKAMGVKSLVVDGKVSVNIGGAEYDTDQAKAIYAFGERMVALSGVFSENEEPAAQKLGGNLKALGGMLSNFGGKVPLVGAILAGYGDVMTEFVNSVERLEKMMNTQNPWVNEATRGFWGDPMLQAWDHQVKTDLMPVMGLRDVYYASESLSKTVWLYDRNGKHLHDGKMKTGNFIPVSRMAPFDGLSHQQIIGLLRKRYRMFHEAGVKNPTVDQILWEANRVVRLELVIGHDAITPGGKFPITLRAFRAVDNAPIHGQKLSAIVSQEGGLLGLGAQEEECAVPQTITWTAPNSPGRYAISMRLSDESREDGWRDAYEKTAGKTEYVVGEKTVLNVQIANTEIAATRQQPIPFVITINRGPESPVTSGTLTVRTDWPHQLRLAEFRPGQTIIPVDGPMTFTGREDDRNELGAPLSLALVPVPGAPLPSGAFRLYVEYEDKGNEVINKTYHQLGRVVKTIRVVEPVQVDGNTITLTATPVSPTRARLTVCVNDPDDVKITAGKVKVTCLDEGSLVTAKGATNSAVAGLQSGYASVMWDAPPKPKASYRFQVQYSGGTYEDTLYLPVTAVCTMPSPKQPETPGNLFMGAETPDIPSPSDGQVKAESEPSTGPIETASLPKDETLPLIPPVTTTPPATTTTTTPPATAHPPTTTTPPAATTPPTTTPPPATTTPPTTTTPPAEGGADLDPLFDGGGVTIPRLDPSMLPKATTPPTVKNFPKSEKAPNVKMTTIGRPPAVSTAPAPKYVPFDAPFLQYDIPANAVQKNTTPQQARGRVISYFLKNPATDTEELVGVRRYDANSKLVQIERGKGGKAHGKQETWMIERDGTECHRIEFFDEGAMIGKRLLVNGVLREESLVVAVDPVVVRNVTLDKDGVSVNTLFYDRGPVTHGLVRKWTSWSASKTWKGTLTSVEMYDNGVKRWMRTYTADEHAYPLKEMTYDEQGKQHGFERNYYAKSGKPHSELYWEHGKLQGPAYSWKEDGTLSWEKQYLHGKLVRQREYLTAQGKGTFLFRDKYYDANEKMTAFFQWMSYNDVPLPVPSQYSPYQNGVLHGDTVYFHKNGRIREIYPYQNGKAQGTRIVYAEDGVTVTTRAQYAENRRHGLYETFDARGKPESREIYVQDKRHGRCEYWKAGATTPEVKYYLDGKEVTKAQFDAASKSGK
jgi:antitoxin component YwqK of YwqJK toxin-antitoxin module